MESNRKKLLFQIIIFAITFVVAFFGTKYFIKSMKSDNSELKKAAQEINKSCPVMIDNQTRLDNVVLISDTIFQYNYTLVKIENKDKNFDSEKLKQNIQSQSQKNLDSNAAMKYQRDNNIYLKYVYKDRNNRLLFDFIINHKKQ